MIYVGIIALIAMLDLCIKDVIENQKDETFPRALKGTKGTIVLHKNHNHGFPFGFLKEKPDIVKMVPLMIVSALIGILLWLIPKKGYQIEKLAVSLTLGGAISNLYDRIMRSYVVDYVNVQTKILKKVVFNLGDIFILIGATVMILSEVIQSLKRSH